MVIIANKSGKLGNRLIVFAHFIAYALENNAKIINPAFDEYAGFFRTTRQDLFCRYPLQRSFILGGERGRRLLYYFTYYLTRIVVRTRAVGSQIETIVIDWEDKYSLDSAEFVELGKRKRLVLAQGWQFRAKSCFVKHAEQIREFFRPAEAHENKLAEMLKRIRKECDVLIGVHIRLGDYRSFKGGKYFFEVDKYITLMRQAEELFGDGRVGFLVCSNERQDSEKFRDLRVFFGTGQPLEDMYGLAGCDFIMGPPSTFSIWASFYGEVPLYQFEDVNRRLAREDFEYSLHKCAIT
jgi:hypothetical protein